MASNTTQGEFFGPDEVGGIADGTVVINERCRIQSRGGYRVVSVSALALAYYAVGDRMGEAHAMVSLVEQGWAKQSEVATAFGCDVRTVRRNQRRFESGGLAALGRDGGYPRGVVRVRGSRRQLVNEWKAEGVANREIARRLGVSETAVRKLLRRLGWKGDEGEQARQLTFDMGPPDANPNLSGSGSSLGIHEEAGSDQNTPQKASLGADRGLVPPMEGGSETPPDANPNLSGSGSSLGIHEEAGFDQNTPQKASMGADRGLAPPMESGSETPPDANPNLSGSSSSCAEPLPVSLDTDPLDRGVDRVMACLGLLEDAPPVFASGTQVPSVGALLAIPALVESGVFEVAAEVYGGIGPAFYGLRTTFVTLLLMALLRIKRPEAIKEHSPRALGRILGLDRAPEVKTLRRKLARLAAFDRAVEFGRALAERRVASRGHAMGFLYVDGHVRAYHGKRSLPKAHVARMRLAMPATTDYWVNDADGEPLFVVTAEANAGLVKMLPVVLDEVRDLLGDRRVTVVFDRGGWSPKLFKQLIASGFDILTYRKGRSPRVPRSSFATHEADLEGRKLRYVLADTGIYLGYGPSHARKRLQLRQVTRLSDDGHQTAVVTSRRDLPAIEVAFRMFERWRQENFFKYLREEYALDALVDYGVEPGDATRDVPNPRRKELNAELRKAYLELNRIAAAYGAEAFTNVESARRTMRGFKIANADLGRRIHDEIERVAALERRRNSVPTRVPVKDLTEGEVLKLRIERKHIADLVKMVAYQAEGDLVRLVSPHYRRAEDEGRTLIQSALSLAGDITPDGGELRVALEPLSSPHRAHALAALCEKLNETRTRFPGSRLRLRFEVKPPPETSLAFPGPRSSAAPAPPQPDISAGG